MGSQIETFLAGNTPRTDQLFAMLIGHNDFGWGNAQSVDGPFSQFAANINTLAGAGAKTIIVANVPPLSHLPAYLNSRQADALDRRVREFNDRQLALLEDVMASHDVDIFHVDFFQMVSDMISDPAGFAITDVTSQASLIAGANPADYLHWDGSHYTSATYGELGHRAAEALPVYLKPMISPLVEKGDRWNFVAGTQEPSPFPDLAWTTADYDDSSWSKGPEGFGHGRGNDVEHVQTLLEDMRGNYTTVYARHRFSVESPAELAGLFQNISVPLARKLISLIADSIQALVAPLRRRLGLRCAVKRCVVQCFKGRLAHEEAACVR